MEPVELLMLSVCGRCDQLGVPYLVTGSVAASVWGEPRLTLDVDILIDASPRQARALCELFVAPDWYADGEAAERSVEHGLQFNIIHLAEAVKADMLPYLDTPHDASRMHRARTVQLPGSTAVRFAAPEDVILKKLQYYRDGSSPKHLRDIAGIWRVSGSSLDLDYLRHWSLMLGVSEQWEQTLTALRATPK